MNVHNKGIINETLISILNNTNEILFVKDLNSIYVGCSMKYATDCALLSCPDDVIGKSDFDLFKDKSLAEKYIKNDKELISGGNAHHEFKESIIGLDGKKHSYLVTKYLIKNEKGEPSYILGQFHLLSKNIELEINENNDKNEKIISALNRIYFASNYVNLKNKTFSILQAMDYSRKMLGNSKTIDEAFDCFIKALVRPEYVEKMRRFCDSDTIAERLKGKTHIDCDYLSKVATGWCQASFLPVDWDDDGNITHVLFVVSSIDSERVKEIEEGIENKKSLNSLFDKVPGGIILYEWDGKNLKTIHISNYYAKLYGTNMVSDGENKGGPDYLRVHPDDLIDYKKAIYHALTVTHHLEYSYRVWNKDKERYVWVKIDAVSEPQEDGTSLVYAMYSDITEQKDIEQELKKKQASLDVALLSAGQTCWEFDSVNLTLDCLTDDNCFGFNKHIENYPECLFESDFLHPDDFQTYHDTISQVINNSSSSAHCDVRALINGKYKWYSCHFEPYFDSDKGRYLSIISVIDISMRMQMIHDYKKRLDAMVAVNKDALSIAYFNLDQDKFSMIRNDKVLEPLLSSSLSLDEVMKTASELVVGETDKEKYSNLFSRNALIKSAKKGKTHIEFEHLFRLSPNHVEWIKSVFDIVREPITGELGGVCYSKSVQKLRMSNLLLEKSLKTDYPKLAVIFADTDEYYLYDSSANIYGDCRKNFWENSNKALLPAVIDDTEKIVLNYSKEIVMKTLNEGNDYIFSFDSILNGEKCRLEIKFSYLDKTHNLVVGTLRNITDNILQKKWKHNSEHDSLTDLYNRATFIKKCREMLNDHPEEDFAICHMDIKHFHLYNTFFGEKAGDDLLKTFAEKIREAGNDYDHWVYGRIEGDVFFAFFPYNKEIVDKHINFAFQNISDYREDFLIEIAMGFYVIENRNMPIESMIARASIAAIDSHNTLGNSVSFYDQTMEKNLMENQQIVNEMQLGIDKEQFEVYLQPKYSLRNSKMVGAEALVRWKHPIKGMISPGKFIPLFESNGFIGTLDRYMWEHVCMIIAKWKKEKLPLLPISVNVSRISIYNHNTVQFLIDLVKKYDIDPKYLELELTESAYMDDPVVIKKELSELKSAGFVILMDDFGSGYSSLNTLKEFPVDILKLDLKFLSKGEEDERGRIIISSILRMSKFLNLPVIAEGVEKEEDAELLKSLGCEYAQGFLFAHPMPVSEYEKMMDNQIFEDSSTKSNIAKNIIKIVTDCSSNLTNLLEISPVPIAIMEYKTNQFKFVRVNDLFMEEFEIKNDLRPTSIIFKENLSESDFNALTELLENTTKINKHVSIKLTWLSDENREYIMNAVYQGEVDNSSLFLASFTKC